MSRTRWWACLALALMVWAQWDAAVAADAPRPTAWTHLALRHGINVTDLSHDAELVRWARAQSGNDTASAVGEVAPETLRLGWYRIMRPQGNSRVEVAFKALVENGDLPGVTLVILDAEDTGLLGEIYARLRQRKFRATTGPDEGIDTHASPYGLYCVYVPVAEVDAISVASWRGVLLHERRHLIQLQNNPDLAADFQNADGSRSLYAGFCEACADDGLYTTPLYYARERMAALREVVGPEQEALVRRACRGNVAAYAALKGLYDQLTGKEGAFAALFWPRY